MTIQSPSRRTVIDYCKLGRNAISIDHLDHHQFQPRINLSVAAGFSGSSGAGGVPTLPVRRDDANLPSAERRWCRHHTVKERAFY